MADAAGMLGASGGLGGAMMFNPATAGIGLAVAGINYGMQQNAKKKAKSLQNRQKEEEERRRNRQMQLLSQQEGEFLHDFNKASKSETADVIHQQGPSSSYLNQVKQDQNIAKQRRLNEINYQRAEIAHGAAFASKMRRGQAALDRANNYASMVSSLLSGGMSGLSQSK